MVPLEQQGTLKLQHCIAMMVPLFSSFDPFERNTIPEYEFPKVQAQCKTYIQEYMDQSELVY